MQLVTFKGATPRPLCTAQRAPLVGTKGRGVAGGAPVRLCSAKGSVASNTLSYLRNFVLAVRGIPGAFVRITRSEDNGAVVRDTQTESDSDAIALDCSMSAKYDLDWPGGTSYAALKNRLGADLARFSAAQAGKPDAAAKLRAETLTFSGLPRGLLGTAHGYLRGCSCSYGQTEEKYCSVDEDDETADLSRVSTDASFSCDRRVSPAFLCFASCAAGCKVRVPFELEIRCGLYYRDLDNDEISPPLNLAQLGVFVMDCGGTWDNDVASPLTGYPTRMALALTGQNLNGEGGNARTTTLQTHLDIAVPESRTVALWPDLSFLEDWVADNLRGRDFEAETAYRGFVRRELRYYAYASFSVSLNGQSAGAAIPVA